jgi:Holliday junction DNA helicase RuvA
MIGHLRGILLAKQPPSLLLEVGGVGYELEAPMSTIYDLPELGREVRLYTHLAIKEDAHQLYGFLRETERALFRSLLRITGIGAKTALAILSGASTDEFARWVETADLAALTRIPGVGRKTAERIVLELKDRIDGIGVAVGLGPSRGAPQDPVAEAGVALAALGYKPPEVARLLKAVAEPGLTAEAIIRKALTAALKVKS